MNFDLFISHSSGDGETARILRVGLETAGYTCWMAPDDVVSEDPWAEQILSAIDASRAMLVLVSAASIRSRHVAREVGLGNGRGRVIVPIRIENVATSGALEYHLEGLQRIDAFPPPIEAHLDRILRRLARVVPLGSAVPGAPLPLVDTAVTPVAPVAVNARTVPVSTGGATAGRPPDASGSVGQLVTPRWQRVRRLRPGRPTLSAAVVALLVVASLSTGILLLRPTEGQPGPLDSAAGGAAFASPPAQTGPVVASPVATVLATSAASLSPTAAPAKSAPSVNRTDPPAARTPRPHTDSEPKPTPRVTPKPTTRPAPTPTPPPALKPASLTSHSTGATIHGASVVFTWSQATGPMSVRYYSVYVGSNPPGQLCTSGYCREPGDDAFAHTDIDVQSGLPPSQLSVQVTGLPADGSAIYVRLFTKYQPESGVLSWRDYIFTSAL